MSYLPIAPHQNSGAHIAISWVVAVFTAFYMLPWAIAATRHKQNTGTIAALNLLLGWTGVGWIISLVLACLADPVQYIASPHVAASYHVAPMAALPPGHVYGQGPYGQTPYAQSPYAQNPYGVSYGHDPYGSPYGPPPAEAAEPSGYVGSADFDPDRRDGQAHW